MRGLAGGILITLLGTGAAWGQDAPAAAFGAAATPSAEPASEPTAEPSPTPTATPTSTPRPTEAASAEGGPWRVAYYYKIRWGFQDEFERLYMKNHHPILLAQKERGRIKDVEIFRPAFHGDGRADWTYLVVITWASWEALGEPSQEEQISRRLFPDRETYRREEQRRFELVEAHWDVPLRVVAGKR